MLDLYAIQSATERAKTYADDTIKRVERYLVDDKDKDARLSAGFCRWCWYRRSNSLAGQMFTPYQCRRCDEEHSHANTAVPALCDACQKVTELCANCCGDLNGNKRETMP